MKFRERLLLAMGPLLLALCAVGVSGAFVARTLARQPSSMLSANYRSVITAERMKEILAGLDRSVLVLLSGNLEPPAAWHAKVTGFESELAVEGRIITEPGEQEAYTHLCDCWTRYKTDLERFFGANSMEQRRLYLEVLSPQYAVVHAAAETILLINQDAMTRKGEATLRRGERFERWLLLTVLAVSLLGFLATLSLTRRLLRPLSVVSETVRRFGQGDVTARARVEGQDEIGLLAREFNGLADHLERYRKSSLGELLQAQQASQAAIDGLPDPVIMLDPGGQPQGCNRAATQLLALDLEHGADTALSKVDTTIRASLLRMHESVRSGRGAYHPKGFEDALRVDTPEGSRVYMPSATPIRDDSEQITGTAAVFQDITRVFHFDELKSDLVSTVAHEFRTPLTSLRMAIHLCLENAVGPLTEKQADLLTTCREDCERLQGMVDDLLDLSRLESGRIELHRRKIEPDALLAMAVDAHRAAAEAAGVSLRVECLPGLAELFVDVDRLQLVFANLVTNAIRYSPKGGEIVLGAQAGHEAIRFAVMDQGQGIAPEYRGAVFEKFFRVPGSPSGGAGLGLFIARGIVVSHGGEIGAEDRGGQGTTFWFTLPLEVHRS